MIAELLRSDYDGPIGILGHVEDEDVALVLQRNLDGLAKIMANLNENK
jgi:arginine repressor